MNIKDYDFNVGDEVITIEGARGKITAVCDCSSCQERGFYEPFWKDENDRWERCISIWDAKCGFNAYYKIGKYRFNDFDKSEVLRDMASCESELRRLKKQLKTIEELESEET